MRFIKSCVLSAVLAFTISSPTVQSAEIKDLWLKTCKSVKIKVGWEIHLTSGEVRDGKILAAVIAKKLPPKVQGLIMLAFAIIKQKDRGNGMIISVTFTGQIVGLRSR